MKNTCDNRNRFYDSLNGEKGSHQWPQTGKKHDEGECEVVIFGPRDSNQYSGAAVLGIPEHISHPPLPDKFGFPALVGVVLEQAQSDRLRNMRAVKNRSTSLYRKGKGVLHGPASKILAFLHLEPLGDVAGQPLRLFVKALVLKKTGKTEEQQTRCTTESQRHSPHLFLE